MVPAHGSNKCVFVHLKLLTVPLLFQSLTARGESRECINNWRCWRIKITPSVEMGEKAMESWIDRICVCVCVCVERRESREKIISLHRVNKTVRPAPNKTPHPFSHHDCLRKRDFFPLTLKEQRQGGVLLYLRFLFLFDGVKEQMLNKQFFIKKKKRCTAHRQELQLCFLFGIVGQLHFHFFFLI